MTIIRFKLNKLMEDYKISLATLSKHTGVSAFELEKIERNEFPPGATIHIETLDAIADFFGLTDPSDLIEILSEEIDIDKAYEKFQEKIANKRGTKEKENGDE